SQVGAWKLDHPKEPIIYAKVFPEFWQKLEKHYYESQKHLLTQMHNALIVYGKKQEDQTEEGVQLAKKTIENMKTKMNYCDHCSKDVILFLLGQKY
ncbi:MAG: hypothetical protein HY072_05970, partial [Deltaproteobacteria bacterium]|nr:hypothetical protein [Deltaproteobacteria bacterium]